MNWLKRIVKSLIVLAVILAAISLFLPRQVVVARTISIDAPASRIYPYVSNFKKFNEWSPWVTIDKNTRFEFSGPKQGKGAILKWRSDDQSVGTGMQEITDAVENESVKTALDFGDKGSATAFFKLREKDSSTDLTWSFETDAGYNPIMRWMGLMFDKWVGAEYERGLQRLKRLVETGKV